MALIGRAALNNPTFLEIDSTLYYDLPVTKRNPEGGRIYPGHKMLKKICRNITRAVSAARPDTRPWLKQYPATLARKMA